ncbi:hypothetical protein ABZX12_37640 [Kribbella sp. NPDC003505]|uniref:hypothetical protein n=1 Tax=Kribbella sp. NPDC003505 TaxID=3154448 RepID=UPI0033AE8F90
MRLYLVEEGDRLVWVAGPAHEVMYAYVANTGTFHNNNALRNDFYMVLNFTYEQIGPAAARRLIAQGVGTLDDDEDLTALAKWRSDPNPLSPADVLAVAAGSNE